MAKILVVDDVDTYRHHLRLELQEQGHEVQVADTPQKAIAIGIESPPDVLVVDWMLNDEQDGLEVAEAIRAANPGMRTILITGHPSAELRRAAMEQGLWFIKKPFSLRDIAVAVDKAARLMG